MHLRHYTDTDAPGVLDVLVEVAGADGGTYPPLTVGRSREEIATWLGRAHPLWRLVAVTSGRDDNQVVGHVQVQAVGAGLAAVLDGHTAAGSSQCLELARLFVAPSTRRRGTARALFDAAVDHVVGLGRTPVLCVLTSQTTAVAMYRSMGWVPVGGFTGVSGLPVVAYVAPSTAARPASH